MKSGDNSVISMECRPVWNAGNSFYFSGNSVPVANMPANTGGLSVFKHFKLLSIYNVRCDISIFDPDILICLNGNTSVKEICRRIRDKRCDVTEAQIMDELRKLLRNNFIYFVNS